MKLISDECVVQLVVIDKNCLYTMAITETPLVNYNFLHHGMYR